MALSLTCTAFSAHQPVPRKYSGEGGDVSPPLHWTGAPAGTRSFALLVDDPDAPQDEPWVHWLIYNISPETTDLVEGIAPSAVPEMPAGTLQGRNSWGTVGYRGPLPPPGHGVHHYHFKLYALDAPLDVGPEIEKPEFLRNIDGHVLAESELIGTYQR